MGPFGRGDQSPREELRPGAVHAGLDLSANTDVIGHAGRIPWAGDAGGWGCRVEYSVVEVSGRMRRLVMIPVAGSLVW